MQMLTYRNVNIKILETFRRSLLLFFLRFLLQIHFEIMIYNKQCIVNIMNPSSIDLFR